MSIPRLSASDLELALIGLQDSEFVSLCNALVWAYAGRSRALILAAFTEREKAKDLGVDAAVELSDQERDLGPFLTPGLNVFQYKRRDVLLGRSKIIGELKRELEGEAGRVARRTGRSPNSYVFFTNVHLNRTQSKALQEAILEGAPANQTAVKVNGAAEIAAML